jgi:hypothetical protein
MYYHADNVNLYALTYIHYTNCRTNVAESITVDLAAIVDPFGGGASRWWVSPVPLEKPGTLCEAMGVASQKWKRVTIRVFLGISQSGESTCWEILELNRHLKWENPIKLYVDRIFHWP